MVFIMRNLNLISVQSWTYLKRARYDKASTTTCSSLPSPKKQYGSLVSKAYPKNLSVVEMLKLGNAIAKNTTTFIYIFMFNMHRAHGMVHCTCDCRIWYS